MNNTWPTPLSLRGLWEHKASKEDHVSPARAGCLRGYILHMIIWLYKSYALGKIHSDPLLGYKVFTKQGWIKARQTTKVKGRNKISKDFC